MLFNQLLDIAMTPDPVPIAALLDEFYVTLLFGIGITVLCSVIVIFAILMHRKKKKSKAEKEKQDKAK